MDLIWMRPERGPLRPSEIPDLSSPAWKVLQALERRFLPRNLDIFPSHQSRSQDQPLPFYGISSNGQPAARPEETALGFNEGATNAFRGDPNRLPPSLSQHEVSKRRSDEPSTSIDVTCSPRFHSLNLLSQIQMSPRNQEMGIFRPRQKFISTERNATLEKLDNFTEPEVCEQNCVDFSLNNYKQVHSRAYSGSSSPMSIFNESGADEASALQPEDGACSKPSLNGKENVEFSRGNKGDCPCIMRDDVHVSELLKDPTSSPVRDVISDDDDDTSFYDLIGSNITLSPDDENLVSTVDQVKERDFLTSFEIDKSKRQLIGEQCLCIVNTTPKFYHKMLDSSSLPKNSESPALLGRSLSSTQLLQRVTLENSKEASETVFSEDSFNNSFEVEMPFSKEPKNSELGLSPHVPRNHLVQRLNTPDTKVKKKFLGTPFKRTLSSSCISNKNFSKEIIVKSVGESSQKESGSDEHTSIFVEDNFSGAESSTSKQTGHFVSPGSFPVAGLNEKAATDSCPDSFFPIFKLPNFKTKQNQDITAKSVKGPCRKKIKFVIPFRKKEESEVMSTHREIQELSGKLSKKMNGRQTFQQLSERLAYDFSERIASTPPQETSMTLQYRGGFCQLNRSKTCKTFFPECLLMRIVWSSCVQYISIPLQKSAWSSAFVKTLFSNKSRKICFETQELIQILIDKFAFNSNEVSSQCLILDPLIGCWLLNPDEPPHSFTDVLTTLKLSEECNGMEMLLNKLSQCAEVLYENLSNTGLWKLFLHIEMRITPILACMELHGIQVDVKKLQEMAALLKVRLDSVQKSAYEAAGRQFQLTSPQQLGSVMYDHLKLDVKHKINVKETEKKHNKSTSEAMLIKFKDLHPLPGVVLEFRRLHKLKSTYVDAVIGYVSENCIYATWDQASAATGRITSNEPNVQAMPKQPFLPELPDMLIRTAFVARKGYSFLAADFQQIELRVFAHLSKDSALIQALSQTTDVFKVLVQQWQEVADIDQVTEEDRDKTKRIVYALMYGAGPSKLADFLHIDYNQARKIHEKFSGIFPKMQDFTIRVLNECRKQGHLTTETGRRRLFPNINSNNFQLRMHTERQAVNFLIQGTAADLCKCAMVHTQRQLTVLGTHNSVPAARLLLQIHDELLWEIPDADLTRAADIVRKAMEGATTVFQSFSSFSVPLPVMLKVGKTWGDMKMVTNASLGTASQEL